MDQTQTGEADDGGGHAAPANAAAASRPPLDQPLLDAAPAHVAQILAERGLFALAHFDSLTGLPNRQLLLDRLRNSLTLAQRRNKGMAVIVLDIDHFKAINDQLGHEAGNRLLQDLVQRMTGVLRKSDTAGRLGDDQFAVILSEVDGADGAGVVARKLMAALRKPFIIEQQEVFATLSLGIALHPDDADDAETLLGFADSAMHHAKAAGRNGYRYHAAALNEGVQERLQLDTELQHASAAAEFELLYQPRVACSSGEIVGAQALLRWRHPSRGLLSPGLFMQALKENGLINTVGQWALREACRQFKHWSDQGLGTGAPTVAFNISALRFEGNELAAMVREALASSGLPADCLELELSEAVLMRNVEQVIATLMELQQLGVGFSVVDFGTSYSSLSYLKRFPLNAVKLGRSFTQDLNADPDEASISGTVMTMAHNLKLKVVAEDVESEEQLSRLAANHCDEIQGPIISPPIPAAAMEKMLTDRVRITSLPLSTGERQRTILLVDDEESILSSLRRLLRRDGFRILTATDGQTGLELLAQNEVDVIISDQRMPGMTGVEFLRRVKTLHPQTVRIVLSGYTELQSITDAINEGAIYKFLTKPWEDDLLRANIEEAFRHKELADENRRLNLAVQAANKELALANTRLLDILADKERRIERDETTLDVAQEILQCIPFPVVGFDNDDMVVFANLEANKLLGGAHHLLDIGSTDSLPEPLFSLTQGNDGDTLTWENDHRSWQVVYKRFGQERGFSGRLLILYPA